MTLWRSGRKSLEPVPEEDLLRLIATLEDAVRRRLGEGFRLVDEAGPGVMRIRLAITEARASDPILDVLRARGAPMAARRRPGRSRDCADSSKVRPSRVRSATRGPNELLAAGVDHRRRTGALPIDTWAEIDRALDFWAERLCTRLEKRTRPETTP